MFLLGEYDEDEAREIADRLKEMGMKVDIRTVTTSQMDIVHYLQGRMSELKDKLDEKDYARYERYIAILRKVVAEGAGPDDLKERLELELDPQIGEKRKQFTETIFAADLSEEEMAAKREAISGIRDDLLDVYNAESFIELLLERNDVQIGDDVASKLEDPIVRVIDNDAEEESDLSRMTIEFTVVPKALIFVDEFSAVLADELDEDFKEDYKVEAMRLFFLGKLISELERPSPEKMDMRSFCKRCQFEMEREGDLLEIDGSEAAEELARALEKNGVIKIKGDSIKWKR